jgi:hypothetical protein
MSKTLFNGDESTYEPLSLGFSQTLDKITTPQSAEVESMKTFSSCKAPGFAFLVLTHQHTQRVAYVQ